jgi:hypothetical protein
LYLVTDSPRGSLTLNAPYFTCQPDKRCSGHVSRTHLDEPPLVNLSPFAMDRMQLTQANLNVILHSANFEALQLGLSRNASEKRPPPLGGGRGETPPRSLHFNFFYPHRSPL